MTPRPAAQAACSCALRSSRCSCSSTSVMRPSSSGSAPCRPLRRRRSHARSCASLGVGARLLAGGHDGGDALFQLRRTRHDEAALPDERAAREHLGRHARELLARVRRRQPRHRDVRAGVHRRKAAQRRARRLRPAADRDTFSALFELQLARHGLAAPGRVFLLVGHEPGARALGRVDPVEHGAQNAHHVLLPLSFGA